jgi:hypothetical protein
MPADITLFNAGRHSSVPVNDLRDAEVDGHRGQPDSLILAQIRWMHEEIADFLAASRCS